MASIAPGGCYPPHWPRPPMCYPPYPPAPEPDPDSLDAVVDWMTYSHPELYRMVHKGLDLTGAMEVSAQWARLGDELGEIGAELAKVVDAAATAWQGEAADLARDTLSALNHWATDTGTLATKVSGCVTIQIDNATNARDEMPAPPYPIIDLPTPQPVPLSPVPPSANAFVSGDFADATAITADPHGPINHEKALHAEAARTMERFQSSSREVYGTVPQFSPPQVGGTLYTGPAEPPQPAPPSQPPTPPTPVPVSPRGPGYSGGPGSTGGGPSASGGQTGSGGRLAPSPSPGQGIGAADPAESTRPAAASAQGRTGGHPGMSGMPMGAGGSRGGEDAERKGSPYIKEDEDIWGGQETLVTPPVIGEDHRRA